jgi:hypothetical protein
MSSGFARIWLELKSDLQKESNDIYHKYYAAWINNFCPDMAVGQASAFNIKTLVGQPIDYWCDNITALLSEQAQSDCIRHEIKLIISNACCPRGSTGEFEGSIDKAMMERLEHKLQEGVLGRLFFLPPLPWTHDLLVKCRHLWKSCCIDDPVSVSGVSADIDHLGGWECRVFEALINFRLSKLHSQVDRLREIYERLNQLALDESSVLKEKDDYKEVIVNFVLPCMSRWQNSFTNGDFMNYLRDNCSLNNGVRSLMPFSLGSRLENGLKAYLFSLTDCSDIPFTSDALAEKSKEYDVFFAFYKQRREEESQSVLKSIQNQMKLRPVEGFEPT